MPCPLACEWLRVLAGQSNVFAAGRLKRAIIRLPSLLVVLLASLPLLPTRIVVPRCRSRLAGGLEARTLGESVQLLPSAPRVCVFIS
jgi:hypothetical protein